MLPYLIQPLAQWIECPVTRRGSQVQVLHGPQGARYFPRPVSCAASVAYVTVWARVVGLRASRWVRYYVLIVPSRPPGLAGCIVSVAELADALDLGSSAFGRVGSTLTGHTGASLNQVGIVGADVPHGWWFRLSALGSPGVPRRR